jgi:hypothetical protein
MMWHYGKNLVHTVLFSFLKKLKSLQSDHDTNKTSIGQYKADMNDLRNQLHNKSHDNELFEQKLEEEAKQISTLTKVNKHFGKSCNK